MWLLMVSLTVNRFWWVSESMWVKKTSLKICFCVNPAVVSLVLGYWLLGSSLLPPFFVYKPWSSLSCEGVGNMCMFICVQLLCMAPPSSSEEQMGALSVLSFALRCLSLSNSLSLSLSLDVVALLWTCFQFTATCVSCADLGRLQLEIHSFTSSVWLSKLSRARLIATVVVQGALGALGLGLVCLSKWINQS